MVLTPTPLRTSWMASSPHRQRAARGSQPSACHHAHAAANAALRAPVWGLRRPVGVWVDWPLFAALSPRVGGLLGA
jgi:hypothetical protein